MAAFASQLSKDQQSLGSEEGWQCAASSTTRLQRHQPKVRFHQQEVTAILRQHKRVPPSVLWYDQDDYSEFKSEFIAQAKKLMRKREHLILRNTILRTFQCCCQEEQQQAPDDENLEDQLRKTASLMQPQECYGDSVVGMERLAVKQVFQDKPIRRSLLVETVQYIQDQSLLMDIHEEETTPLVDDYKMMERLRVACERITRPSRLFAAHLAQAKAA